MSPHLAGVLSRLETSGNPDALAEALTFAINHGALTELDFVRETGISFNPRPARIGLILLNEAGVRRLDPLAAAALACVHRDEQSAALSNFPTEIWALALSSTAPPEELSGEAQLIALSALLDRARHLHLAPVNLRSELWPLVFTQVKSALPIAAQNSPHLGILLRTWAERFERRLSSK